MFQNEVKKQIFFTLSKLDLNYPDDISHLYLRKLQRDEEKVNDENSW